jgi:phytoene/squalene synthetase
MTVRFTGDVPAAEDVLGVTERLYEDAVIELERTMAAIKAGEFNEVKSAQEAIRSLRATAIAVLQERGKVDQLRKQIAGHSLWLRWSRKSATDQVQTKLV